MILKRVELPVIPNDECQVKLRETRLGRHFILDSSFMCAGKFNRFTDRSLAKKKIQFRMINRMSKKFLTDVGVSLLFFLHFLGGEKGKDTCQGNS